MTSKKLASKSPPRVKYFLKRTLKRTPFFREIVDSDLKWLWAAYRKGAFAIDEDLPQEQFKEAIAHYFNGHNALYMMLAKVQGELVPVGIMACQDHGYRIEPFAVWLPWASARNKLESALNFFNKIRVTRLGVLFVPEKEILLFEKIARYGILQRRGTVGRFFEDGQFAAIFQTRD